MRVFSSLFCFAGILLFTAESRGDVALASWTFETSLPLTSGPHVAEAGVFSATSQATGSTGGVFSNPVGNGSAESFSSTAWDVGDFFQFTTSTTGYEGISIEFSHTSSGTGPRDFGLQYAIGASPFTSFASYAVLPNQTGAPGAGSWSSTIRNTAYDYVFDLSSITGLDDVASIIFRLVQTSTADAAPPGTVAAGGTSRVDNVVISGIEIAQVPEPSSIVSGIGLGLTGIVWLRRRQLHKNKA